MSEKFIKGVKPLEQFMEDGSFLMPEIPAVFRAMQALNAPEYIDYDYLLSVSGMAVRLAWQQGWAGYEGLPNQRVFYNEGNKSIVEMAFDRIGINYTIKNVSHVGIETAKSEIKKSIDKGIPVLIQEPYVYATVLGYKGDDLYGVSTFADKNKRMKPNNYNCFNTWQEEIKTYIIINEYNPKAMDRELLKDVLRTAIYLARATHLECWGDTSLGISSFDAIAEMMVWDENFEPLEPGEQFDGKLSFPYVRPEGYYRTDGARTLDKRFGAGYCDFLCMLNGYENFSRFLKKYADIIPEWCDHLKEAAEWYLLACDYSGELWNYVTPDDAGVAKFKSKEVRYTFAAHMLRAKIYTIRAIEILEYLLK